MVISSLHTMPPPISMYKPDPVLLSCVGLRGFEEIFQLYSTTLLKLFVHRYDVL